MPNDHADPHPLARAPTAREPAAEPDPKVLLDHIAEVSRNASATWFGLLGLLAFVGITLLGHRDADFFARGAGTQLPLVSITVPVEAFFLAAPALVAAVYSYFHLYLMSLWDALADAPARIDGQPLSDRIYPWLITYAALWYRDRRRRDGSSAPRPLGWMVVFVSVIFGWLAGIVVLGGLWWRSMPAHDEWLTLWSGACLCFAALIGLTGFAAAGKRMAGASRGETAASPGVRWQPATAFAALVAFLSWEMTEGTLLTWTRTGEPILLVSADLREAELTPRPPDWKPFELWLRDFRRERGGDPAQNPLIPTAEEVERYRLIITALDGPALKMRDLRRADLSDAFLVGTDLRGLDARGAVFRGADLRGARLGCIIPPSERNGWQGSGCAQMQGADLRSAQMQAADLSSAQMQGANLEGAQGQVANLSRARLRGAALREAFMQAADLRGAEMQGADLSSAQLQGADLTGAQMQGANLNLAQMQGASLRTAHLERAYLDGAQLRGADLSHAKVHGARFVEVQMQGANLNWVEMATAVCHNDSILFAWDDSVPGFAGALTHAADLSCVSFQEQLEFTVGDADTIVPAGMHVWSCLDRSALPPAVLGMIEDGLADRSYGGWRPEVFCDAGEIPHKVGRQREVP